jgi:hypothetical protein
MPATSDSDEASPSPSPGPPPAVSYQQHPVDESTTTDRAVQSQQSQQILQLLANPAAGPVTTPQCIKCGRITSRTITKQQNQNGNALRPFYKCYPCNKFHCFDDLRGNDPANPPCYCGVSSKRQASGVNTGLLRRLHYVCRLGTCNYYKAERDFDGNVQCVDDEVVDQLALLRLL